MLADDLNVEQDEHGQTERGWLDFTFQNYYALLNCGFRVRPTAGTASGVHPVPLGFGRVYVHLPDGFSYDAWMAGLDAGRSVVTTGPMLVVTANGRPAGTVFPMEEGQPVRIRLQGWASSDHPLSRIEIISSKGVLQVIKPQPHKPDAGAYATDIDLTLEFKESTWAVVRCFEQLPNGRVRFAHTSPFHINIADKPLHARKHEVQYLVDRVQRELERNTGVLNDSALAEFREALRVYQTIAATAE